MRKLPYLVTLVLLCLSIQVHAQPTILILGDSLSTAYGFETKDGWVELFKQRIAEHKLNYTVINASVTGSTTSNGVTRLPALLLKYKPALTVIELGGNDALLGIPITTTKKNLEQLIELCQKHNSKVAVLAIRPPPNYGKAFSDAFTDMYQSLSKNNVTVTPLYAENHETDSALLQIDKIHPTKEAQLIILDRIWPALKSKL